jgi:3-hydroxyisobutyrate dehydrogenase-like beta-hydroxyacid dehydrogenase
VTETTIRDGRPTPIGLVGLGVIGSGIATSLLRAGFAVCGFDVDPRRSSALASAGLMPAASAREVAELADVVLVSVMTGAQVLEVVNGPDGLLAGQTDGLLVLNASTIDADNSGRTRDALAAAGSSLLCTTISGSAAAAAEGTLTVFCSGERSDYERVTGILDVIGRQHTYLGAGEIAQTMKLLVNLVVIGTMALLAEAATLAEALGVDAETTFDQLCVSAVASPFIAVKAPAVVGRDYTPTATTQLVRKDLGLIRQMASAVGHPLPITDLVDARFEAAEHAGFADSDFAAVAEIYRDHIPVKG